MNPQTEIQPQPRDLSSKALGGAFLLCVPFLLSLVAAATFWAAGVAGAAYHFMCVRWF